MPVNGLDNLPAFVLENKDYKRNITRKRKEAIKKIQHSPREFSKFFQK